MEKQWCVYGQMFAWGIGHDTKRVSYRKMSRLDMQEHDSSDTMKSSLNKIFTGIFYDANERKILIEKYNVSYMGE